MSIIEQYEYTNYVKSLETENQKNKEKLEKVKEWLSDNVRECPDTPENISLKEDNKRLLKFIEENEDE